MGADNQQERLGYYIAGYVDGEGSFHIGVQKSRYVWLGYQLVPELHISQNAERSEILKLIRRTLECGYIKPNDRTDPTDVTQVLVVRKRQDLVQKVLPFFERYPILSSKRQDFEKFAQIVKAMDKGEHLERSGFARLLKIAFSMNGRGKYRKWKLSDIISDLESSETIRRTRKRSIAFVKI